MEENTKGLQIQTLGGLSIRLNGKPLKGLASRKAEALLVFLVLTGETHSREVIATTLWDDRTQERALSNLSVLLSSLRKHINPNIEITRQTVAIKNPSDIWVDALELEKQLRVILDFQAERGEITSERAAALEQALDIYSGDFLQGFHIRDSRWFEEWCTLQRERLCRTVLIAMDTLVDYLIQSRAFNTGLIWAKRLTQLDALREKSHRQIMWLHTRLGERSAALTQYETCCEILQRELGVTPSVETNKLYDRILVAGETARINLPTSITPFIGREEELKNINRLFANPDCRLVTLVGPGGTGKTRLAIEAARAETPNFLNGVFFIPLGPVLSPELLIPSIASSIGLQFIGRSDPQVQLFDYLREKEMLLIMDGFEHLVDVADILTEIVKTAPEVRLLTTSREKLNIRSETIFQVEGLAYPPDEQSEDIRSFDAIEMFTQSARRSQLDFDPSEKEQEPVARICRMVEGSPLAIELAAAWIPLMAPEMIAAEIEHGLDILSTSMRDVPMKHRSMRAAIDYSWRLLSKDEQLTYQKLSIFVGGFDCETADQVASARVETLSSLTDKSLLKRSPSGRYEFHQRLRQYAEEKMTELPQENEQLIERYNQYFTTLLSECSKGLMIEGEITILESMDQEIDNIRTVWNVVAREADAEKIVQCVHCLYRYYLVRGLFQEGERAFRWAADSINTRSETVEKLSEMEFRALGLTLARQGVFVGLQGEFSQALKLLSEALDVAKSIGDKAEIAFCLIHMGMNYWSQSSYDQSELHIKGALEHAEDIGNQIIIADALNQLGVINNFRNDYKTARHYYQRGYEIRKLLGNQQGLARSLSNLGDIAYRLGEYKEAKVYFLESIQICEKLGYLYGKAAAYNNLGNVEDRLECYDEAKHYYQKSLTIKQQLGERRGAATTLNNLGGIAALQSDYAQARQLQEEALAIHGEVGNLWGVANSLSGLGEIELVEGHAEEAEHRFREALRTAMQIESVVLAEDALIGLASVKAERSDVEGAMHLATFIANQSLSDMEVREKAETLIKKLSGKIPLKLEKKITEATRDKNLETVVNEILAVQ